ncbi:hypothetical protein EMIT0P43_10155 [Pseudomonas jessenii]
MEKLGPQDLTQPQISGPSNDPIGKKIEVDLNLGLHVAEIRLPDPGNDQQLQ